MGKSKDDILLESCAAKTNLKHYLFKKISTYCCSPMWNNFFRHRFFKQAEKLWTKAKTTYWWKALRQRGGKDKLETLTVQHIFIFPLIVSTHASQNSCDLFLYEFKLLPATTRKDDPCYIYLSLDSTEECSFPFLDYLEQLSCKEWDCFQENHLRWDSLGEYLATAIAFQVFFFNSRFLRNERGKKIGFRSLKMKLKLKIKLRNKVIMEGFF